MTSEVEERVLTWERHGSTVFSGIAILLIALAKKSSVPIKGVK